MFGELLGQRQGVVVDGVEPDPETAESARERLGTVYDGFFPDAVPAGTKYDCITFLDCLEHMVDPWSALRSAADHLNPGGVVVASIPNIRFAPALKTIVQDQEWPWDDGGIFDRTHVRFFTVKTMPRLFEMSGFKVDECTPVKVSNNLKHRFLARLIGQDVRAMQFVLVARPA